MTDFFGGKLGDEPGRIAALERYDILDTPDEGAFDKITGLVRDILGVPICAVSLIDRDRQYFKSRQGLAARETPRDISFCTHTIGSREAMMVPDATADPRFAANPLVTGDPNIKSYCGVPLETPDGYNVGALCAIDTVPRSFDPHQIALLSRFAALVVDEMELRRIAQKDHLTGAATRRAFVAETDKAIARRDRNNRPSALLLLDIDHFKAINDGHGHPAGDAVLRQVAAAAMRMIRRNDSFGRIGGEEFGILLGETEADQAMDAAERFRAAIERIEFDEPAGVRVTASFGVAPLVAADSTSEQWLRRADVALYRAKRNGRNRAELAMPVRDAA